MLHSPSLNDIVFSLLYSCPYLRGRCIGEGTVLVVSMCVLQDGVFSVLMSLLLFVLRIHNAQKTVPVKLLFVCLLLYPSSQKMHEATMWVNVVQVSDIKLR